MKTSMNPPKDALVDISRVVKGTKLEGVDLGKLADRIVRDDWWPSGVIWVPASARGHFIHGKAV